LTLGLVSALALFVLASSSANAACPNEAIREAQATTGLPACMGLEMVSPPNKFVEPASNATISVDGGRVRFKSLAGLAGTPGLHSFSGDNYVATRGPGGWETAATSPPAAAEIFIGGESYGGPFAYASDLTKWNLMGGRQTQVNAGVVQAFHGGLDGTLSPISPVLVPIDESGSEGLFPTISSIGSTATSTDLSISTLVPAQFSISLLPGDPVISVEQNRTNNYVLGLDEGGSPSIELLARAADGTVFGGKCGANAGGGGVGSIGQITQGAISPDGSRIYFTAQPAQPFDPGHPDEAPNCDTSNPLRILERISTPAGPAIKELIPGGPAVGSDLFQGASGDGSKVYFTSTRPLAVSDLDSGPKCSADPGASVGCDLYLYDSSKPPVERLTQVSVGAGAGKSADVLSSITAISGDGSHAYFVAEGVLTGANAEGRSPVEGKPNLYLYERDGAHIAGRTAFLGTLDPGDKGGLWGTERSYLGDAYAVPLLTPDRQEVGGDGHILAFASKSALTANDNDGTLRDVYRYDADSEGLICVSCATDAEPQDVVVNKPGPPKAPSSAVAVEGRWVSEDGSEIGFYTAEPLVEGDSDKAENPYFWRQGALVRIPATTGESPTLSIDGEEIGFATRMALLPQDIDTASDVYVVRVGGGFPNPEPESPCVGEGCQGSRAGPPANPPSAFNGPGNQPPVECKKGYVKKKGKCVKKNRGKKHKQKKGKKKPVGNKRGGKK
jgi:WD40-like Beta Propeller Repeat